MGGRDGARGKDAPREDRQRPAVHCDVLRRREEIQRQEHEHQEDDIRGLGPYTIKSQLIEKEEKCTVRESVVVAEDVRDLEGEEQHEQPDQVLTRHHPGLASAQTTPIHRVHDRRP